MQLFAFIYIILYYLMMVVVSNSVIILKIYATLLVMVIHVNLSSFDCFKWWQSSLRKILARVKMFYKENEQKSRRVLIMQKFWSEIWYMSTLLAITFDRKIALMQGLRHWKLDFKSFPTVYYMPNSKNEQKMTIIWSLLKLSVKNADSSSWSWKRPPTRLFLLESVQPIFQYFNFVLFIFIFILINFLGVYLGVNEEHLGEASIRGSIRRMIEHPLLSPSSIIFLELHFQYL